MTIDIQLQDMPVDDSEVKIYDKLPEYVTGMEIIEPYDPNFRFTYLSRDGNIEVMVRNLCERAAGDPSAVQGISLVLPSMRHDASYSSKTLYPFLTESGGTQFFSPDPSKPYYSPGALVGEGTCLLVGDSDGYYAPGRDVLRVIRNRRENSHQAIIRAGVGTIFAVGYRAQHDEKYRTICVYRIDDHVGVPRSYYESLEKCKKNMGGDKSKVRLHSSENPAAFNASLISLRLFTSDGARGWDRPPVNENDTPVDTSLIIDSVLRKLAGPCNQPTFIETFYSVNPPPKHDHEKRERYRVRKGQSITTLPTQPDNFIKTLIEEVASYRRLLFKAKEPSSGRVLPLTSELSYIPSTNDVQVLVTIPRVFSDAKAETMSALQIVTVLPDGQVPDSFVPHSALLGGATDEKFLHESVLSQLVEAPAIMVYLHTHA